MKELEGDAWRKKSINSARLFLIATITREIPEKNYCSLPHFSSDNGGGNFCLYSGRISGAIVWKKVLSKSK